MVSYDTVLIVFCQHYNSVLIHKFFLTHATKRDKDNSNKIDADYFLLAKGITI